MPTHWTYADLAPASDLEQGDILKPTEELRRLFSEIHPHFAQEKYLGYLVATQSCDLVQRKGSPKASYVTLAVIRPLAQVLPKLIAHVASVAAAGVFLTSSKIEARRLVERILNQNEQALGLFYLHQDSDSGIGEPSVCFLRVSVALRSEHYHRLVAARTGRVAPDFQAKLGWLLGNLYSRPATRDWQDKTEDKAKFDKLVSQYVEEQIPGAGPRWLDDEVVREAKDREIDLARATPEELEGLRPLPPHERAIEEVKAVASKLAISLSPERVQSLGSRVDEINAVLATLEPAIAPERLKDIGTRLEELKTQLSTSEVGMPEQTLKKLENRLKNSGKFKKLFKAE